jgi:hypothetical protein
VLRPFHSYGSSPIGTTARLSSVGIDMPGTLGATLHGSSDHELR